MSLMFLYLNTSHKYRLQTKRQKKKIPTGSSIFVRRVQFYVYVIEFISSLRSVYTNLFTDNGFHQSRATFQKNSLEYPYITVPEENNSRVKTCTEHKINLPREFTVVN